MLRIKLFFSLTVIVLAVALAGGATLAWFTAATDPIANVFTAGTLEIEAGGKSQIPNWNPGDQSEAEFCVTNVGSKNALVRIGLDGEWSPGPYRILVLYRADNIQLVGVKWDTFCKGCTDPESMGGYLATARVVYSSSSTTGGLPGPGNPPDNGRVLNNDYYFGVRFHDFLPGDGRTNDDMEHWFNAGELYHGWCIDNDVSGTASNQRFEIYDPLCTPDWYNYTSAAQSLKTKWSNIDFDKISYLINHNFLARGYNSTEMQQAIWMYSNGDYLYHGNKKHGSHYYYLGNAPEINAYIDDIANTHGNGSIVDALNSIPNTVSTSLHPDSSGTWLEITFNDETHYYYNGVLGDDEEVCLKLSINLSGPNTGNMFQGMEYTASGFFEAVQASNNASFATWSINSIYDPDEPESSDNWDRWDF